MASTIGNLLKQELLKKFSGKFDDRNDKNQVIEAKEEKVAVETEAEILGIETDPRILAKMAPTELGNVGTVILHCDLEDKKKNGENAKAIAKYLQGPFLGKGGFAKVYQFQDLGT